MTGLGRLAVVALLAPACSGLLGAASPTQPKWTAQTSVEMTYFGEVGEDRPVAVPSPDKNWIYYLSRRGDVASDTNVFELRFVDVTTLRKLLAEGRAARDGDFITLRLASASPQPAIGSIRWNPDSASVTFAGTIGAGSKQVYRYDLRTRRLSSLTATKDGVDSYAAGSRCVIFTTRRKVGTVTGGLPNYPGGYVTQRQFTSSVSRADDIRELSAHAKCVGQDEFAVGDPIDSYGHLPSRLFLSPDERFGVVSTNATPEDYPRLGLSIRDTEGLGAVGSLRLIDFRAGTSRPLPLQAIEHASDANPTAVSWSPDGASLIIVGARSASGGDLSVLEINPATGQTNVIARVPAANATGENSLPRVNWAPDGQSIVLENTASGRRIARRYTRSREGWSEGLEGVADSCCEGREPVSPNGITVLAPGLSIRSSESLNEPPALWVVSHSRRLRLSPEDEVVSGVLRARVSTRTWTLPDGRLLKAGLFLPAGPSAKPLPLVVQIYNFEDSLFRPDGYAILTAYAAQPLASRGFAVLQLGWPKAPISLWGPQAGEDFDFAVAKLAEEGLIDPKRVGVVGFSNGAYRVDYILTHPGRTRPAAAVSAEGMTASYGYYLTIINTSDEALRHLDVQNDFYSRGGSFWQNKRQWVDEAPGFNLDKIRTPLLMTMSGNGIPGFGMNLDLEFVAGLRANGVPYDYLWFPNGTHPLRRPRERLLSQQSTVDWMAFWLKGEPPSDPIVAHRWDDLRARRDRLEGSRKLAN